MKRYLQRTLQTTPRIWLVMIVEILVTSLLYTSLSTIGVPKSTSFYITLGIAIVLIVLGLLLIPKPFLCLISENEAFMSELPVPERVLRKGLQDKETKPIKPHGTQIAEPLSDAWVREYSHHVVRHTKPVEIFYSYAHEDEAYLKQLKSHLRPLQRKGLIELWYDREIHAGAEWANEIEAHLNTAQIILLLVSPDFMASDYCYSIEMKQALERYKRREARVIPIILRPSLWKESPIGELEPLPTSGKPITRWFHVDEALLNVTKGIGRVVNEVLSEETREDQLGIDENG